jgi:serine/threonine-protein kinase RsbT
LPAGGCAPAVEEAVDGSIRAPGGVPMRVLRNTTIPLVESRHLVQMRQAVREHAIALKFSLVDQTKIVTAASELGRNTITHGEGGEVELSEVENGGRMGLRLTFRDAGPGIADIEQALRDGFSSGSGLGLGLGGAQRLSNEFAIESRPGQGTRVTIVRWR